MHVFAPLWKWTRYACKSKSVLRKHLARTYYVRYVGMCVCVSSALIWCLNKWFLPPRVCLQYITLATMELPLSSSLGTSRSLAHAWPRGKCRPVNNTEMLNDVRTPTQGALSDTVSASIELAACSLLFSFLDMRTLFFLDSLWGCSLSFIILLLFSLNHFPRWDGWHLL